MVAGSTEWIRKKNNQKKLTSVDTVHCGNFHDYCPNITNNLYLLVVGHRTSVPYISKISRYHTSI